ncbi:hypothetical protein P3W55_13380 [Pseudomonas citronellolis]|uniref:Uncharacterized protein n=1 Tax=Pseudomonas citronellolis TaxID=53408 RepID=A0AAW6P6A4_9PSED|nr:hypothetical protein [Pseudomonas citronellolis]MDF3842702.1 hypothetical protein [Pseudomonas citronellolis]
MRNALHYAIGAALVSLAGAGLYILAPVLPALIAWEWGCHL